MTEFTKEIASVKRITGAEDGRWVVEFLHEARSHLFERVLLTGKLLGNWTYKINDHLSSFSTNGFTC